MGKNLVNSVWVMALLTTKNVLFVLVSTLVATFVKCVFPNLYRCLIWISGKFENCNNWVKLTQWNDLFNNQIIGFRPCLHSRCLICQLTKLVQLLSMNNITYKFENGHICVKNIRVKARLTTQQFDIQICDI